MMTLERQVAQEVRALAGTAAEAIVGGIERERARIRAEACIEEQVAAEMFRRLPRWRWLARLIWRSKHRRRAARCAAIRLHDPEVDTICNAMKLQGEQQWA